MNPYTNRPGTAATGDSRAFTETSPAAGRSEELVEILDRELLEQRGQRSHERRGDAGTVRQRQGHLEVLVRPAEPVLAPLLERPVGTAARRHRRAQRGRLDPERPPEPHGLDVGADAGPEEDVVRGLRDLPGA